MVIDTTSRKGMESSLAHLMGVSVPELYQYIEAAADSAVEGQWCFNQDLFDKAMEDFYSDMIEQELPDEILFFHLSRRRSGDLSAWAEGRGISIDRFPDRRLRWRRY